MSTLAAVLLAETALSGSHAVTALQLTLLTPPSLVAMNVARFCSADTAAERVRHRHIAAGDTVAEWMPYVTVVVVAICVDVQLLLSFLLDTAWQDKHPASHSHPSLQQCCTQRCASQAELADSALGCWVAVVHAYYSCVPGTGPAGLHPLSPPAVCSGHGW